MGGGSSTDNEIVLQKGGDGHVKGGQYPLYASTPLNNNCNLTMYKYDWRLQPYQGYLANDPLFWRYQTQTFFVLTQGLALDLAVSKCKEQFENMIRFRAGRTGPVDVQHGYKAMCSKYCMESDLLHQQALAYSTCSCEGVSSQPSDPSYTYPGDWCQHNSARMLCNILGYCGKWNCRVDDFMCPRYEWNKEYVHLKGPGSCLRNSGNKNVYSGSLVIFLMSVIVWLLIT